MSGSDGKRICLQNRRPELDPWVGKVPWRRKWNPFQYCLGNSMDSGAWWAIAREVAESQIRLCN